MNCTRGLQDFIRPKNLRLSVGCLGHNGIISLDRCKLNNWMELYTYIYKYMGMDQYLLIPFLVG